MSRRGLRPLNIQTNVLLLHNSSYFFRRENILKKGMITKPIRAVIHDIEILLWKYLVLYIVYYIHTRQSTKAQGSTIDFLFCVCCIACFSRERLLLLVQGKLVQLRRLTPLRSFLSLNLSGQASMLLMWHFTIKYGVELFELARFWGNLGPQEMVSLLYPWQKPDVWWYVRIFPRCYDWLWGVKAWQNE